MIGKSIETFLIFIEKIIKKEVSLWKKKRKELVRIGWRSGWL